jgi:hypothetical protein
LNISFHVFITFALRTELEDVKFRSLINLYISIPLNSSQWRSFDFSLSSLSFIYFSFCFLYYLDSSHKDQRRVRVAKEKRKKARHIYFHSLKLLIKNMIRRPRAHAYMHTWTHTRARPRRIHASTHPRIHAAHNTPVVLSVFFSAVYGHRSRGDGRSQMGRMINARSGLVPGTYVHITHTHAHFRRALTHMRA